MKKPKTVFKGEKCKCCGHQPILTVSNKLIFTRHKLAEKAFLYGDPKLRGTEPSLADELRADKFGRNDIGMVNLQDATGKITEQLMVYPSKSGEPKWGRAQPFFTEEELEEMRNENRLMLEAERDFGVVGKLVY